MLWFALITVFAFIVGPWGLLSGSLYRKPFFLVLCGLALALTGGWFSYIFEHGSEIKLVAEIFPDLKLSAALVGFTVAATGGSLIASGIVLKAQHQARIEKSRADTDLQRAIKELERVKNDDEELKSDALKLNNDEFKIRLQRIRSSYVYAHERVVETMRKSKELEF
ncbi:conserved membrane hypothetical protein [Pseudomonas sp. 9AZ]|uniref:hypothetical protein n=1 Tax=Pseudomonas sp. 9AZ TaxID=2653168 RepID=UPI0012EF5FA8|nr:hypothetical protein [Pseudomonas sp. 9AZ]VXC15647.1 conserved membrane hypothetical protein [Pseudomonas sp. 9AZ]